MRDEIVDALARLFSRMRHKVYAHPVHRDAVERGAMNISKRLNPDARKNDSKRWKDIWSAGHSVSGVEAILTVRDLVEQTAREYEAAKKRELERLQTE